MHQHKLSEARPEWLLVAASAFYLILWLHTRALHSWIAGMTGNM